MAVVGVASFPHETGGNSEGPPVLDSLLLDLLNFSPGQLLATGSSADGHVTYGHTLLEAIAASGAAHLTEAVILSLPLLLRSITEHWGPLLPGNVQDMVATVGDGLFQYFNE